MDGWLGRLALVALLVLVVLAAGCGGDDEAPTIVDLTGFVTVENLSDEIPVTEEALEAAIVESIQERAPDDVEVVYRAGGGGGTNTEAGEGTNTEADEATTDEVIEGTGIPSDPNSPIGPYELCRKHAGSNPFCDLTCWRLGCTPDTIVEIVVDACAAIPVDCGFDDRVKAGKLFATLSIGGTRAEVVASETGELTAEIEGVPPDGEAAEDDAGQETTGTETGVTTTETAPVETPPVETAPVEPIEPAPAEPEPAPVEPPPAPAEPEP